LTRHYLTRGERWACREAYAMEKPPERAYEEVLAVSARLRLPVPLILYYYTWGGLQGFTEHTPELTQRQLCGLSAAWKTAPSGYSRVNRDCLLFYTADEILHGAVDRLASFGCVDAAFEGLHSHFYRSALERLLSPATLLSRIGVVLHRAWGLPEADEHSRAHLRALRGVFVRYAAAHGHDLRLPDFPV
jgi:hypothetical protein